MQTLLFGVILGPDFAIAQKALHKYKDKIDGVELRLDSFSSIDLLSIQSLLHTCPLPVMITLRRKDQGGEYTEDENTRLSLIEKLCSFNPAYVDLEYDVPIAFRQKLFEKHPHILFLSSYHDFSNTPEDLEALYAQIKTPFAHIFKLAVTAKSCSDALKMLLFVQNHSKQDKLIGICMGDTGNSSRILAPLVGNYLTYASLLSANAPGQLTADTLQDIYRFNKLSSKTQIFALLGSPVDNSLGHIIHNAIFEKFSLNAVYVKFDIQPQEFSTFLNLAKKLPFKGFSVTMPLKESILSFLSHPSDPVQSIQSCNTILLQNSSLLGFNTDGIGAINAVEKKQPVQGKHVVLAGAGGAAKAIAFEALNRGARVTILNRSEQKALDIAQSLGCEGGSFDLFPQIVSQGYDILLQCTAQSDSIPEEWILPHTTVMDIVYVPKYTPFLQKARQKNCRLVFGYEMFMNQALEQLRIWFPSEMDLEQAEKIIEEKILSHLN